MTSFEKRKLVYVTLNYCGVDGSFYTDVIDETVEWITDQSRGYLDLKTGVGRPDGIETDTSRLVCETSKETHNSKTTFAMNEGLWEPIRVQEMMSFVMFLWHKMCLIISRKCFSYRHVKQILNYDPSKWP